MLLCAAQKIIYIYMPAFGYGSEVLALAAKLLIDVANGRTNTTGAFLDVERDRLCTIFMFF